MRLAEISYNYLIHRWHRLHFYIRLRFLYTRNVRNHLTRCTFNHTYWNSTACFLSPSQPEHIGYFCIYLPLQSRNNIEHALFLAPSTAESDDPSASGGAPTTTIPFLLSETTTGEEITTTATSVVEETTEEEEEDDRKKRRRRKKPKEKCYLSFNIKIFKKPKNWFQGINSASLRSLAGRYDNPIPTRFLAPSVHSGICGPPLRDVWNHSFHPIVLKEHVILHCNDDSVYIFLFWE